MKVVITGGAGFLGARLATELLRRGSFGAAGAPPEPITSVHLIDQVAPGGTLADDSRVHAWPGELVSGLADGTPSPLDEADLVFHLAAVVSRAAEQDFDLGLRVNLGGTQAVLARCRAAGRVPVVVFSSSVAVFGGTPTHPLPAVITDDTLPTPQSSYGIQKFIGEQLVADYTRKGFITGRTVRLMTVSVRPGRPNAAASSFLSGIIREPLAGIAAASPVGPETMVALSSPARAVEGLLRAADAPAESWGDATAINLPPITIAVGEMVDVLERVGGPAARDLVGWQPDEAIAAIVRGWPSRVDAARAAGLGLDPDADFEAIVRAYVAENSA